MNFQDGLDSITMTRNMFVDTCILKDNKNLNTFCPESEVKLHVLSLFT